MLWELRQMGILDQEKPRFNLKGNNINYALLDGISEFDDEDNDPSL